MSEYHHSEEIIGFVRKNSPTVAGVILLKKKAAND
jgi:hypothetical protein